MKIYAVRRQTLVRVRQEVMEGGTGAFWAGQVLFLHQSAGYSAAHAL